MVDYKLASCIDKSLPLLQVHCDTGAKAIARRSTHQGDMREDEGVRNIHLHQAGSLAREEVLIAHALPTDYSCERAM